MINKVPVLVCHFGNHEYVKNALRITSKNNKVIFIGDNEENTQGIDNVDFIDVRNIMQSDKIIHFKNYFKPYNTSDSNIVWLWYLRVFLLSEYIFQTNIDTVFHIDSDNVLLDDVSNYHFQQKIAYCIPSNTNLNYMTGSIHSGLLNKQFFNDFEDLYSDIFINKSKYHLIESKIRYHENFGGGGICDMTLFYLIYIANKEKIQNLLNMNTNKSNQDVVFMNDLNDAEGLEAKKQYKTDRENRIEIFNFENDFFIYDHLKKCYVKIMNIHFQGKAKSLLTNKSFLKNYKF